MLLPLMDWLESYKKEQAGNDAISNEVVASAHIENHAMKLFLFADKEDRESRFNKNVVKGGFSGTCYFLMINCLLINKSTLVQLTQLKFKFIKEIRYKLWVISENAYLRKRI